MNKLEPKFLKGVFLGLRLGTNELYLSTDKGVVPPAESQQAASILRAIEEKPPAAVDVD